MSENHLPTDSDLLHDFVVSSSDRSFELLVHRYGGLVFGVCRGVLRDAADADDAAQAAFLVLARKAKSLRGRRTIAGWLHHVAWNISSRARRARELRRQRERDAATSIDREDNTDHDSIAELHDALDRLPEKYRLPLILHHLDGWDEQEVAAILGCKLGTVSGRLSRGRAMLREKLHSLQRAAVARERPDETTLSSLAMAAIASSKGSPAISAQARALANSSIGSSNARRLRWLVVSIAILLIAVIGTMLVMRPRSNSGIGNGGGASPGTSSVIATVGAMQGIVVDPTGQPVRGVTVRLYLSKDDATANRRAIARVQSSADGAFAFEDLAPREHYYLLCFIQQPTFMHGDADVNVIAEQRTNVGTITLKTGRY